MESTKKLISEVLSESYDVSEISARIIPFDTFDSTGNSISVRNLVVLDKDDRFMFAVNHPVSEQYIGEDGWINYEMIYLNFIAFKSEQ